MFSEAPVRAKHDLGNASAAPVAVPRAGVGFCAAMQIEPVSVIRTLSFESENLAVCIPTPYIPKISVCSSCRRRQPTPSVDAYLHQIVLNGQASLQLRTV